MPIQDSKLDNFQRIIFALTRQIPADWKDSKILIPYDDFICNYIYYFIDESYNLLNVVEENYAFAVNEILRPILKLYKSKQNHNLLTSVISTAETKTIIQFGLLVNFFGGFIGSVIGTLTILFLYINEYLPIDLLKLQ